MTVSAIYAPGKSITIGACLEANSSNSSTLPPPQFSAEREGVDPVRVHKEMHVRRKDGTLAVGVDAFIAIWDALPRYSFAARIGKWKIPHLAMQAGYVVFANHDGRCWLTR